MFVLFPKGAMEDAVVLHYLPPAYKTFCFPVRHFLQGNLTAQAGMCRRDGQTNILRGLFPGLGDQLRLESEEQIW